MTFMPSPVAADQPQRDPDVHRTVCVSSLKGGTGKTTSTTKIAQCLARLGLKVLVVDMDAEHAGLTAVMGLSPLVAELTTTADLFAQMPIQRGSAFNAAIVAPDDWQPLPGKTWEQGGAYRDGGVVMVIPGDKSSVDRVIDDGWDSGDMVRGLRTALSGISSQFDLTLIDVHPDKKRASQMAMQASGWVLGMFTPEPIPVDAIGDQLKWVDELAARRTVPLRYLGAVCTKFSRIKHKTHGQSLYDAWENVVGHKPASAGTGIEAVNAPGGVVHVGGLFPQLVHDSAALTASQRDVPTTAMIKALRPVDAAYTQIGLRILQIVNPAAVEDLIEQFASEPLPGVWPLPDDNTPPAEARIPEDLSDDVEAAETEETR